MLFNTCHIVEYKNMFLNEKLKIIFRIDLVILILYLRKLNNKFNNYF